MNPPPLKPGVATTEFWITLAGVIIQGAMTLLGMLDAPWAALGITILSALYTLLRTSVKRGDQEVQTAALSAGLRRSDK